MAVAYPCECPDADAILACALAHDVDRAFEQLVIAYRVRIVTFVARMLHDDARAEDVAQDVFVRAYRALQTYSAERRSELRLRSWLFAIAHNLTRNVFRDAPPLAEPLEYSDGAPRAELLAPEPGPEQLALREEAWKSVDEAIARLTPALRSAFVLRYVDDLPYDEIAQTLGQPVGTVKASAHRGLLAVRAQLEKNDG
ncbi:MAG TPA: RNA polymerase sigma factor [Candidatus Elarobacter sp.]|nr:RNA polymerase sigma factor [Candidatus Elarobacter sp.]